jgi:hypothetical protein
MVKEGVNKSNHPIQNPLVLVTEPRTRDNIIIPTSAMNYEIIYIYIHKRSK